MANVAYDRASHELIDFLNRLDADSGIDRDKRTSVWDESKRQYLGDHWRADNVDPMFSANLIRLLLDRKSAFLGESKPSFKVSSRALGLAPVSKVFDDAVSAIWDEQSIFQVLEDLGRTGPIYGAGFVETVYDPLASRGLGDIVIREVSPENVAFDPNVKKARDLQRANFIIITRVMALHEAQALWPAQAQLMEPDAVVPTPEARGGMIEKIRAIRRTQGGGQIPYKPSGDLGTAIPAVVVKEYYYRDPKYPTGRLTIRQGSRLVVDDGPNPYWDGGWPLDMMDWLYDPNSPWGKPETLELRRLQEAFTRMGDAAVRNAITNAYSWTLGDRDALDPEEWHNIEAVDGLVVRKNPGRELARVAPPALPGGFQQLMEFIQALMGALTGMVPVTAGQAEGRIESGIAIEGLQVVALVSVRQLARRLEALVQSLGQKLISRIFQFYTEDRLMLVTGPTRELQEYTFERSKLVGPLFALKPEDRKSLSMPLSDRDLLANAHRLFSFKVTPGSLLPFTKLQRSAVAQQLFQAGIIDDEEVLRTLEWPNSKDLIQRNREFQKQKMAAQAAAQAQAGGRGTQFLDTIGKVIDKTVSPQPAKPPTTGATVQGPEAGLGR